VSAYHRTTEAGRRSKAARRLVVLPAPCARCGNMIEPGQPFDMGHATAVALGGQDSDLRPEHRRCNRNDGGKIGGRRRAEAERRRKLRPTKPAW
jgi:hypothetical protein